MKEAIWVSVLGKAYTVKVKWSAKSGIWYGKLWGLDRHFESDRLIFI